MKYFGLPFLTAAAFFASSYAPPALLSARTIGDSDEIAQLLADTRMEATALRHDAEEMDTFASSKLGWHTQAGKVTMIKEHINASGKLLKKLQDLAPNASTWQLTAIQRIDPLLRELAANTEVTIRHMNENPSRIHMPEFRDYVKANYELAQELETMIRNAVDYGETKEKFDRLSKEFESVS